MSHHFLFLLSQRYAVYPPNFTFFSHCCCIRVIQFSETYEKNFGRHKKIFLGKILKEAFWFPGNFITPQTNFLNVFLGFGAESWKSSFGLQKVEPVTQCEVQENVQIRGVHCITETKQFFWIFYHSCEIIFSYKFIKAIKLFFQWIMTCKFTLTQILTDPLLFK